MADTRRLPGPQLAHWDWKLAAACRGMASTIFFHPPDERGPARENRIRDAKKVCQACPVRKHSGSRTESPRPYGIWGGLSEDERAQLLGVQSLRYPGRILTTD